MCRLLTPQFEEAIKEFPLYSQDGKGKDAICCAVFELGPVRWYILEAEKEGDDIIMYGIVIGLMEDEYGYSSLDELSGIELDLTLKGCCKHKITQLADFKPKPLKEINEIRLKHFLSRFED